MENSCWRSEVAYPASPEDPQKRGDGNRGETEHDDDGEQRREHPSASFAARTDEAERPRARPDAREKVRANGERGKDVTERDGPGPKRADEVAVWARGIESR